MKAGLRLQPRSFSRFLFLRIIFTTGRTVRSAGNLNAFKTTITAFRVVFALLYVA